MQINQLRADSTHSSPTFQQPLQSNAEPSPSTPDFLPDFKVSNVLAKNQEIEIFEGEHKPLDHFFNRMNELGYEANNVSQTFVMEVENFQSDPSKGKNSDNPREPSNNDNFPNNDSSPPLQSKFTIDKRFRSNIKKRIDKLDLLLSNLNFQKFNIIDALRQYAMQETILIRQMSRRIQEKIEEVTFKQQNRIADLETQLDVQRQKCRQLEQGRQHDQVEAGHLSKDLEEMQTANNNLNEQLEQAETQNNQLKYQLRQSQIKQKTVQQLQEEIATLNQTIDQNCEYIFDLEQKVAGASLELEAQEAKLKKQYELQGEEEREKIENEYKAEFQKVQQQLHTTITEQLEEEYHASLQTIKNEHQQQLAQLHQQHSQHIQQLEQENMQLVKINREYQSKLHQTEQYQLKHTTALPPPNQNIDFSRELENSRLTSQSLEKRLREKEEELNFYKEKAVKPYAKTNNILVMDQHQQSMQKEAISPSSSLAALYHHRPNFTPSSRDDKINTILSRIRLRQTGSILSQLNDSNTSRQYPKGHNDSIFLPVSPESMILQKEKDMRMRNISHKLEQLRADIRREIGMIHH